MWVMANDPLFQLEDWAFTWDPVKAKANFIKHGVTFTEGATSFLDPYGLDGVDEHDPSYEKLVAYSDQQRLLLTVYIEVEGTTIRIVSARRVTPVEREAYERSERRGGRVFEARRRSDLEGYQWRRNPYATALARFGIRVLGSALPHGARSFESWATRRDRPLQRAR